MMTIILVVFDYVERVDDFTELHAPWDAIIFDYYLNFIPHFINQFSALFTFISVISATSSMRATAHISIPPFLTLTKTWAILRHSSLHWCLNKE